MRIRFHAIVGASLALLLIGPAMAKPPRHHATHGARHSVQSHYDYRSANSVREEFTGAPRGHWMRPERHFDAYAYEERYEGRVVENLRGDFTGGVGYGADGNAFVDGYGQTHFFVGSFRRMNPLPHGPYTPNRFGPGRRGF